ncbi:hypothetical protein NE237_022631 [Protea cynaroides]|uniref:Bromo domain-containing protein n=1 Tax=Protea cynaroides TaxID=273540 RepID=A0A9Q0HA88_9MAGN|nr:hypothetical protein NE237_022631 [Protea cynaroides]
MGKVVETKKKKKGRPSLLDLQKRSLRQQQQQQQQKRNPNSNPYSNSIYRNPVVPNPIPNPNPNRRFTRRNSYPDGITEAASEGADAGDDDDNDEDDDDSNNKRREKKLKFVLRLPSNQQHRSLNSSLNSASYGSDSNAEDENSETPHRKRRINANCDGSGPRDAEKGVKPKSASKVEESGSRLESGPTTPIPDEKLLLFILDRLQKKDTYGVFSEPVDPNELPDYHEIIQHPMDFATVRKKLAGGAYANLEQFERDVFLICSNAMRYNSADTIYYRQARSMQELAKKDFENLRQDSDDNEPEPEPKVARRGRPPTKHLKKPPGRPPFERAGSEFSSDATLATAGDNATYDQRKGSLLDRSGLSDASGRTFHGFRTTEAYTSWLAERKSEKNDEFAGSGLKGTSVKYGKKQFVLDENRRNTYKQFHPSAVGCKSPVFTAFDGEPKQLMNVGLQAEYGYARSLARFAANLGTDAWKIASQKIAMTLPAGQKFGPGWVGEREAPQPRPWPQPQPQVQAPSHGHLLQQSSPLSKFSSSAATAHAVESKGDKTSENSSLSDVIHRKLPPPSTATTSMVKIRTPEPSTAGEVAKGSSYDSGFSLLNSSTVGAIRPRPSFQILQNPLIHNTMNGSSGGFGFNVSPQMGKLVRPGRMAESFGPEAAMSSGMLGTVARSNNFVHQTPVGQSEIEDQKLLGASNTINSRGAVPDSSQESQLIPRVGQCMPSWGGLSVHQKTDSVPPDLNVRFHSPGSPSSGVPVESPQPDLALQL